MKVSDDERFIKRVESLIDPAEVCDLTFIQRFKRLLPRSWFKALLFRTSRKYPRIGFVIEPYSLFLFFRLADLERARSLLPARYELVRTRICAEDEPGYYHGMGIFGCRGSTFWGARLESYLIARDRETGLVSWIFIDILSNAIIAQPRDGVADRNCVRAVHTTDSRGELFVDFEETGSGRRLRLKAGLGRGIEKPLDRDLWLGGNTSIAYTERLSGGAEEPFAVIFDPAEVDRALELPLEELRLEENTLSPGLAEGSPCKALCFPFAQHYLADSPGLRTVVSDEADMLRKYDELASLAEMETFSTRGIKRLMLAGVLFSCLVTLALAAALVVALAT